MGLEDLSFFLSISIATTATDIIGNAISGNTSKDKSLSPGYKSSLTFVNLFFLISMCPVHLIHRK